MRLLRLSPVEIALGIALTGLLAAVAVPAFARELAASRFVEPTTGLTRLGAAAVAYAEAEAKLPASAPLTPAVPPRGKRVDPPGTWDGPTWRALDFRPSPDGVPHAYSFAFDANGTAFVAHAKGDLDGDGILSTFEIRGAARPGEKAQVAPGMYVEAELE